MSSKASHFLVADLNEADFAKEVEQSPVPVLLDFHATWCGPCKALAPVFDALAETYASQARFFKVDIDDNRELAQRLNIRGVPSLLLFQNGQVVERVVGGRHKAYFSSLLDKYVQRPVVAAKNVAGEFRAFHGDAGLREQVAERVRSHIQAGRIVSRGYSGPISDADQQCYSLMGAAAETADLARFEGALGIPAAVGRLQEAVHSLLLEQVGNPGDPRFRLNPPRDTRPLEWWRAIPPGADLRWLPSRFIDWLLRDLVGNTNRYGVDLSIVDRTALESLAQLHGRMAQGEVPAAREWQSMRDAITPLLKSLREEPVKRPSLLAVFECAEQLAWPADELEDAPAKAVGKLLSVTIRAKPPAGYTPERWAEQTRLFFEANDRIQKAVLERHQPSAHLSSATPEQMERLRRLYEEIGALEEVKAARALMEQIGPVKEAHRTQASLSFGEHLHAGLMEALSTTISSTS